MNCDVIRRCTVLSVLGLLGTAVAGCATNNHTQNGALVGAGLGAGAGAILGHQSGNGEAGAMVGGALGAISGAIVGNAEDAWEQRDAAVAELAANAQPANPPLTNFDLVRMSQAGLGDEVIINAVQTRGGQFQLDPDGLISLKSSGVSDRVLECVQTAETAPAATAVAPQPTGIVVVRPRPVVGVHIGSPAVFGIGHHHHRRWYHSRHPRHHSGLSFSARHHF